MYHRFRSMLLLAAGSLAAVTLRANPPSAHNEPPATPAAATVRCEVQTDTPAVAGKQAPALVRLTGPHGKPLALDDLQVAHTEKLHLLVVDETLTDYHHEHPIESEKPGEYLFEFSPKVGGTYHIWADIVPTATGRQEYVKTQVKVQGAPAKKDQSLNTSTEADGYRFTLTTENNEPLQAGKATVMQVKVTTVDGKEVTGLEPVMGAFAHMVAFPETLASVTHVHPMEAEPKAPSDRGGPELSFHVEPETSGLQKFFLQTQIRGREVYAAFGLEVKAAPGPSAPAAAEYTCPMHPELKQRTPGECPKCGMTLVPNNPDPHQHKH